MTDVVDVWVNDHLIAFRTSTVEEIDRGLDAVRKMYQGTYESPFPALNMMGSDVYAMLRDRLLDKRSLLMKMPPLRKAAPGGD